MSIWDTSLGEDTLYYARQAAKTYLDRDEGKNYAVRVSNGIDSVSEVINTNCANNKAEYVDCIKCSDGFVLIFKYRQADEHID